MRLEDAIKSLDDEKKKKLLKLGSETEIKEYFKSNGIEIDENYELSDDELDNVTGGVDLGYIIRLLLKQFGVVEKAENVMTNIIGGGENKDNNNNTNFM